MRKLSLTLTSVAVTHEAGLRIGRALPQNALVLLEGELGAGKTTMVKAICEALAVRPETVISPTYTLVNVYPGQWSIFHVDLFRLASPEDLLELDRDDWINPAGPTLIEWPEPARPLLDGETMLEVALTLVEDAPQARQAEFRGQGPYAKVLEALSDLGGGGT